MLIYKTIQELKEIKVIGDKQIDIQKRNQPANNTESNITTKIKAMHKYCETAPYTTLQMLAYAVRTKLRARMARITEISETSIFFVEPWTVGRAKRAPKNGH